MIGIVDYGMGNLRSVLNAIRHLGYDCQLVDMPDVVGSSERLILPGVGAYAKAMANLKNKNLEAPVKRHIAEGKPFLGICLGMQLLSSIGQEDGPAEGLGVVRGEVSLLPVKPPVRLPHVGWNVVTSKKTHPVMEGIKPGVDFYFVHSFAFRPMDPADALTVSDYAGTEFVSSVARGSAVGFQFHPEKSQDNGLKILDNFCNWDGKC